MQALVAAAILATTVINLSGTDAPITNPTYDSPTGRFRLVERLYPGIPDFGSQPSGEVWAAKEAAGQPAEPVTFPAVLYEVAFGWPAAVGRLELPFGHGRVLVSDEGWMFVELKTDERFALYRENGTLVRELAGEDIFSENDIGAMKRHDASAMYAMKDGQLVITLPATIRHSSDPADYGTIHIDREGNVLEEKRDIYPPHRVWPVPVDARPAAWPDCAERGFARVGSGQLLARATKRVIPEYPLIAKKARISGLVIADVVVNASGEVVCSRLSKPLPFLLDVAVNKAIAGWKFEPGREPVAASIGFRFGQPEHAEWRELSAPR